MGDRKQKAKKLIKVEVGGSGRGHYHLEAGDECYYYGEYTARGGYACSPTNQTIINLKKKIGDRGYHYKAQAISQVARAFASGLRLDVVERGYTFVPVPPSKAKGHAEFDDRMLQVLHKMGKGHSLDIRELVVQDVSTDPSHILSSRPGPEQLAENYRIVESIAYPEPKRVFIVDDVLTMGAHFKAVQTVLQSRYPGIERFIGLFYARTVHEDVADDFDVIDS